ncbi:MAG TPA: hypothetical protein ENI30_04785, partial [Gammaproteobacteria bacterium]|nr:hypothetical protein [Gammaproteobacteria bacterium]
RAPWPRPSPARRSPPGGQESNSTVKPRRQQEDQRRMAFRRAIEDRCDQRQLQQSISRGLLRTWVTTEGCASCASRS